MPTYHYLQNSSKWKPCQVSQHSATKTLGIIITVYPTELHNASKLHAIINWVHPTTFELPNVTNTPKKNKRSIFDRVQGFHNGYHTYFCAHAGDNYVSVGSVNELLFVHMIKFRPQKLKNYAINQSINLCATRFRCGKSSQPNTPHNISNSDPLNYHQLTLLYKIT